MSRKISIKKRLPTINLKYNSFLISIFINKILKCGKKFLAQKIVSKMFNYIKIKTNKNPILIFENGIKKISPKVQLTTKSIGGSIYKIPVLLSKFRSLNIGIRWIIDAAKKRTGNKIYLKLANELLDITKGIGNSLKKKEETYKIAESNKVFI